MMLLALPLACTGSGEDGDDNPTGATLATSSTGSGEGADGSEGQSGSADADDDATDSMPDADADATADADADGDSTDGSDGTDTGSDTGPPGSCGNGVLDEGEMCDEPNGEDADGCNEDCTASGAILFEHTQSAGLGLSEDYFAVTLDEDGNAYVAGTTNPTADGADYWVRQYTAQGGLGFELTINGSANAADAARDIVYYDDAVYVVGNLNVSGSSNNWATREYTTTGAAGYAVDYNSAVGGSDVAHTVAVDTSGNIYVGGRQAVSLQGQDVYVRQYLPGGGSGWTASYTGPATGDDRINGIAVDPEGNVIIGGWHTVSGQGRDVFVRKLDPAGATLWTMNYAGAAALDDEVRGVATDDMGNIVVVGIESMTLPAAILWMRAYDPDGNELWTQTHQGATSEGAQAFDVAIDSAGHVVVVGIEVEAGTNDALVRKYDASGNLRWSQTYETTVAANQLIRGVTIGPDDRIWIAGGLNKGIDGRDAWIAQLAP